MTNVCAESNAFQEAQLKSERFRIRIVLGVVGAAILLPVLRTLVVGGHENVSSSLMMCGLLAVFSAYEYFMLHAVNRAIQNGRECGNWVWLSNIILETCLPALAVAFLSSGSIDPIYRPLANPAGLAFFLLISLSTLRLNPWLCRLSGLAAALNHLVASAYLGWRPALSPGTSLISPQRAVFGYAIALVIGGFVSGMVAGEIRKQVEAALREAEAQRQVDRLEHDLSVARSIQQSLLPNVTPEIGGFEIAGWNQPAEQTGGDYYDWQVLPNGTMVAELADVL